ncbi:glycosyltransferase family 2 protein [Alloiococcus sp. CFN-8]|uniref:glycosyltransferase family 2 protein n=1 Tax=Alloiococcus sp. CFN-8 TaxID=3416081 RepID=UPI003CEF06D9
MKKQPLVTIITPCCNGEDFLNQYFESILAQTYKNIELIFVNDGSIDNTELIAKSYGTEFEKRDIRYVYLHQKKGGQAKAMNTGLKEMKGEYLVWPDSDDLLSCDSIEKRVRFLEEHPQYSFVRSNGDFFDFQTKEKLHRISNLDNRFHEDIFLDLILEETYCCCGCYMIRSNILKKFYPDLTIYESPAGQNWQLLIPIAGKYLCGFIDEDLYHIAVRSNSHSRQQRTLDETVDRLFELKKVLNIGIQLSGRNDRDYDDIVNIKYLKILFRCYMKADDLEQGELYYRKLRKANAVENQDYRLYLKKMHPMVYSAYNMSNLFNRIIHKLCRITARALYKEG